MIDHLRLTFVADKPPAVSYFCRSRPDGRWGERGLYM